MAICDAVHREFTFDPTLPANGLGRSTTGAESQRTHEGHELDECPATSWEMDGAETQVAGAAGG